MEKLMKRTLALCLLVLSASSFAGSCHLKFGSSESMKLPRKDGYTEKHSNVSLEACVSRAESLMGSKAVFPGTIVLPDAVRLITEGSYSYSNSHISVSGNLFLKN